MTLPKKLLEKRDELAKEWTRGWNPLADETNSVIALNYKKGFKDCAALLIPEIEKLHNMLWETRNDMVLIHNLLLDYYSEENVYFRNPEYAFNKAKESLVRLKALQSLEEFLND